MVNNDDQLNPMMGCEDPQLEDFDMALSLFIHFLEILSCPLPEYDVPVAHATHHGIQTILAVVAKEKRGTSLVVWDHGVLWRTIEGYLGLSGFSIICP